MTFAYCWNHLEAAVVTEAADIKSVSERSKLQGGTEIIGAVITIQDFTNGKCQVCGRYRQFYWVIGLCNGCWVIQLVNVGPIV